MNGGISKKLIKINH